MKREEEKSIRRWLKKKISINQAILVLFFITGGASFAAVSDDYVSEKSPTTGNLAERIIILPSGSLSNYARYGTDGKTLELLGMDGTTWKTIGLRSTGYGAIRGLGNDATAMGYFASALGNNSVSIGGTSRAIAEGANAIGYSAKAEKKHSIALGQEATVAGSGADDGLIPLLLGIKRM